MCCLLLSLALSLEKSRLRLQSRKVSQFFLKFYDLTVFKCQLFCGISVLQVCVLLIFSHDYVHVMLVQQECHRG